MYDNGAEMVNLLYASAFCFVFPVFSVFLWVCPCAYSNVRTRNVAIRFGGHLMTSLTVGGTRIYNDMNIKLTGLCLMLSNQIKSNDV